MPEDALQAATTIPMTTTLSEPAEDRLAADRTASLNTVAAPGGRAWSSPWTRRSTVEAPTWIRLAAPSSAISIGNKARNQW